MSSTIWIGLLIDEGPGKDSRPRKEAKVGGLGRQPHEACLFYASYAHIFMQVVNNCEPRVKESFQPHLAFHNMIRDRTIRIAQSRLHYLP